MRSPIHDIHHGNRQEVCPYAANILKQRQFMRVCRSVCHRERCTQHGIRSQTRLVLRAVQRQHHLIDIRLIIGFGTGQNVGNFTVYGFDRFLHAFTAITAIPVPQFQHFVRPRGCAGGNSGATESAILQINIHLDCWITSTVENFACVNVYYGRHRSTPQLAVKFQSVKGLAFAIWSNATSCDKSSSN